MVTRTECDHDEYERLQLGPNGIVHYRGCRKCHTFTHSYTGDAPPLPRYIERIPLPRRDLDSSSPCDVLDINHDTTPEFGF